MENNSGKRYSGLPGRTGNSRGTANFENLKQNECLKEKSKEWEVAIPERTANFENLKQNECLK
jgi:hypothetical protein